MSEAVVDGVDTSKDSAGGEDLAKQKDDKVAYETYRKTVDAEKKAKQLAADLAKKVKEYEDEKLQNQGKSQELIESLRNQVKEKEEKLHHVVGSFAHRAVSSRIREEAIKQGCLDTELLLKAGSEEFAKIEVNAEDGFSVNSDDLKRFFETTMKNHPTLFKSTGPKFHDSTPRTGTAGTEFKADNLKGLKFDDYKKLLAMKLAKK